MSEENTQKKSRIVDCTNESEGEAFQMLQLDTPAQADPGPEVSGQVSPKPMDLDDVIQRVHDTGISFIVTDIDIAMTMLDIARTTQDPITAQRNQGNARRAYDAVRHLMGDLHLSNEQNAAIEEKLSVLRAELEAVGETF
jgi:hypothetical protein